MSNFDDKIDDEIEDTLTDEEQRKIESIQEAIVVQVEEQSIQQSTNIFSSILGPGVNLAAIVGNLQTEVTAPFNLQRVILIDKFVRITNISGKDAYVILTPAPITTLSAFGLGIGFAGMDASVDAELDTKGDYKAQKISIPNNTGGKYTLDNSQFCCTLYINDGTQWKKSWDNRRFNGRKFDINILEKHAAAALDKNNIPDF
jgi:hypothetical protein